MIYVNAQSLMVHKEELQHQIVIRMKPAILALSETRLIKDMKDSEINISGYSAARCDSENRKTGGILI